MKAHYLVNIENPEQNIVKVSLKLERKPGQSRLQVFLPSWSPGSYLMREYARHIRWVQVSAENGEILYHTQKAKGVWEIDWDKSQLKNQSLKFDVTYVIYLNELTVRTSQVNSSHAFLHGPSYLMGVVGEELANPTIEFRFPSLWSKLSTSLKDVSEKRELFIYTAKNYDELIDCPVEIGCQETDGFVVHGKNHHLAFYGEVYPYSANLKQDIKTIVEVVARHFNQELPYDQYLFLTHFAPKLRGGLEHLNSTALQFDGRKLASRKDYIAYLSLVAHEYFHLWNVKRIRPKELGPFDYLNENYTSMLWLAEGLTSFMDDLLVYRAGLCTLEEYLDQIRSNLEAYFSIPGKKFHSLEQSSFNAWIKLYRPDENSKNSSVSYYLKGGLVFNMLHLHLLKKGKSINDLLIMLWGHFKQKPEIGLTREDVYSMVNDLAGEEVLQVFSTMIETTNDIDFESAFKEIGLGFNFFTPKTSYHGIDWEFQGERVFAKSVTLDSPAHKAGINPGDEILFINGLRLLREDVSDLGGLLETNRAYDFIISRMGKIDKVSILLTSAPRVLKDITILDRELAEKSLRF